MLKILPYLKLCVEKGGSDLFFVCDAPPQLKVEGVMAPIGEVALTRESVQALVREILTDDQLAVLAVQRELDMATEAGGLGRFRVNVFHQRGALGMVLRYVRSDVPALDQLEAVPAVLKSLVMQKRGMLLMVGATGSGKSTTLAAMIRHRNEHSRSHILTIEEPIEFVHPHLRSIVSQRELGDDTMSFERALKSALREAPDVILIGEIRSRETMDACMQLANVGHLVLATLHANNAYQALQRVVNLYPEVGRDRLYMDLAMTLRAVVSQRLVRREDGRRMAAVEVMLNTPYVEELILNRRIDELPEAMRQSTNDGMQTFEDALFRLYKSGRISREEALSHADSPTNLEARINFGG